MRGGDIDMKAGGVTFDSEAQRAPAVVGWQPLRNQRLDGTRHLAGFDGGVAHVRKRLAEELAQRVEKRPVRRQAGFEVERHQSDIRSNSVRVFSTSEAICAVS